MNCKNTPAPANWVGAPTEGMRQHGAHVHAPRASSGSASRAVGRRVSFAVDATTAICPARFRFAHTQIHEYCKAAPHLPRKLSCFPPSAMARKHLSTRLCPRLLVAVALLLAQVRGDREGQLPAGPPPSPCRRRACTRPRPTPPLPLLHPALPAGPPRTQPAFDGFNSITCSRITPGNGLAQRRHAAAALGR